MRENHVKLHREVDSVGVLMKIQNILPGMRDWETFWSQGITRTYYIFILTQWHNTVCWCESSEAWYEMKLERYVMIR